MSFIKKQSIGFYFAALAVIAAVVATVFYLINCNTAYFSNLGVNAGIVGCLIVGVIGSMKERGISVQKKMGELAVPVRWGLYYALVIGILIFAAYGDGYQIQDLIYAGF